ncbi:beta-propeller domain-containing protein [Anaerocellum danielii]|uniref:Beta-propeller domain-containing protein n=1 Tax=Anaerocellum danielii TaxID=1387557 RepID=A0ABZ0U328_9FIRM|nr:beta-propeller domain-containing protein [Caldicellulosiruptor danielii]WPX08864.1 beta-propeller domain-containing protein [Caldicellulosiruptor danielii]
MLKKIFSKVLVLMLIISLSGVYSMKPKGNSKEIILPKIGSFANFKKLIDDALKRNPYMGSDYFAYDISNPLAMEAQDVKAIEEAPFSYSETNVQVSGVDEADIAKTDGEFIYIVGKNERKLKIVKAYPAQDMKLTSTISFEESFYPKEFYVDSKYLVVICEKTEVLKKIPKDKTTSETYRVSGENRIFIPYYISSETMCIVYDISDRSNPKVIRKVTLDGRYLTSRKVGSSLHIVSLKHFPYNLYLSKNYSVQDFMPYYSDSNINDVQKVYIGFNKIGYVPDFINCSYTLVGSFGLETGSHVSVECILGGGDTVYCSKENLYVCAESFSKVILPAKTIESIRPRYYYKQKTAIYRFELSKGTASLKSAGFVEGKVLNQFSMDEYDGYFRIATTVEYPAFLERYFEPFNAVYVFDKNLKLVGKLDKIAKGERIYSARFMGKRLYLVTFKALDPFFVISLENPQKPEILGYLKIPGYSTYLHPYDQNHIIGFGKDAEDLNEKYAIPLGLKIAMFNVEDVKNPKELFKVIIGGKGTNSELLNNHKALLFDKNKNIFAFPVEVYEKGKDKFTGAYVYSIDLKKGFVLMGKISHEIDDKYKYYDKIKRLLYIEDVLYSVSDSMLKAISLGNLEEIARLRLD